MNGVKISAVGHYAPAGILTNEDLEKTLDTSDEWITTRTGMKRRHIAAPNQATSDLAIAAIDLPSNLVFDGLCAFARTIPSQPPAASTMFHQPGEPVTISRLSRARTAG